MLTMVSNNSNENLIKLKELSDKICASEIEDIDIENKNAEVVKEIKKTIDSEINEINSKKSEKEKLSCYEKVFSNLKIILNKIVN